MDSASLVSTGKTFDCAGSAKGLAAIFGMHVW